MNATIGMILVLLIVPIVATSASTQSQTIQLETLVQAASSSRNYAITIVGTASTRGFNTTNFDALLVSGNASLATALSDLSSNSNLNGGIQMAQTAMGDFMNASVGASLLLLQAESATYIAANAKLDSVVSANATATSLYAAMVVGCKTNPTNSSYVVQFQDNCSSGKNYVSLATADLNQAHAILSSSTLTPAGINESSSLIVDANANLSLAATVVSHLAQFLDYERAQQYLAGPFAKQEVVANNTISGQRTIALDFNGDVSQFQTYQTNQASALDTVDSNASSLATSIQTTLTATAAVSSYVALEETDLSTASSDMTQLSLVVSTLPQTLVATLQTDISTVQADISTSSSSETTLNSQAGSCNQISLASLTSYSTSFQSAAGTAESDNQALLSSLQTLQAELTTLASIPTLSSALLPWVTTTGSLYTKISGDAVSLTSASESTESDITGSMSAVSAYQSTVLSAASDIETSAALLNSTESIYASEATLLNATSLATVNEAVTLMQTTSQQSTSFVAVMNALLSTSVSGLGSSVQTLSASADTLKAQASSAQNAITNAYTVISANLQSRSSALASANLDASNALTMFEDLQISNGASLLAQANQELQIASS